MSDKQRNKAAIRQRDFIKAAKARHEAELAAGTPEGKAAAARPAGPWNPAEVSAAITREIARFPPDVIAVRLLSFRDRAMNLPGYQSGGEPLKASPPLVAGATVVKRNGHTIVYVPVMRHFVVVWHDVDKRMVATRCVHDSNVLNWEPAAEVAEEAAAAA